MKRRLSIFLIFILIMQSLIISPKKVAADTTTTKLPTNSIVIGDRIYSSAYMNTYLNEVNLQIQKYPNSMYLIDTSGNIVNMLTKETVSEDQLINLTNRLLTYFCLSSESDPSKGWTYGSIFIADSSGKYQPVLQNTYPKYGYAIANINASDSSNSSYKLLTISINNINGVTDAYYYIIDDKPINNENSYIKRRIYETAVIITPKTTKTLYVNIYSSSDSNTSLIASGSIPLSTGSDIINGSYSIPFLLKLENIGIGSIADRITGNISNNGIGAYEDGFIYYSNYSDKGKIYKKSVEGTDDYPITEDNAKFINVQNGWVYYSNYSDGGKIYRVKTDGTSRQKLNNAMSSYINVVGDYVYYVNNSDKGRIYKLNYLTNAGGLFLTNGQPLTNERASYLVVDVLRNLIYFSNASDKSKLYSITTDGLYKKALSTVGVRFLSVLSDGTLYCSGVDGKLYKYNPYGSVRFFPINITTNVESKNKNSTLIKPYTEKFTVLNVVTPNDIYYRSNVDQGKIYKANSSGNGTKIIDDSADAINVIGNSIYYTKSGKIYRYELSNSDKKPESVAKIKYSQKIVSINPIDPADVSDVNNINFPEMVSAIMSDGSIQDLVVNWDVSKPSVKNGTYTYKGKVVGYGNAVTFSARINSDKINPNNVIITNNEGNNVDSIEIAGLIAGDVVSIYDPNDTTKPLKKATVGKDGKVTISKLSLNQAGGTLGITVTRKGKAESQIVYVSYLAEVPTITSIAYDKSNKVYTVTYKGTSSKVDYYINNSKISTVDAAITQTAGVFTFNIPINSITDVTKNNTVEIAYSNTTNKSRSYTLLSQNPPNVTYDVISGTFSGLNSSIEVSIDGTNYIPYSDLLSNNLTGKKYIIARYEANQNKLPGNPSYVLLVGAPTVKIASVDDNNNENIIFDTNNPLTYVSNGDFIEANTTVKKAKVYFENVPTGSGIEFTAQYTKDGKTYNNINSGDSIIESGVYTLKLILKVNGNVASSNARDIRFKVFNSNIQKPEIYIAGVTGKEETTDGKKIITAYDPRPTLTNYTDLSLNISATIEKSTNGDLSDFGAPLQYSMVGGTGSPIDKEGLYRIKVKYYKTSTSPQIESEEAVVYVKVDKTPLPKITLEDIEGKSIDDSLGQVIYSSSTGLIINSIVPTDNIAWENDENKKVDGKRYTLVIKYHKIGDTEWKIYDPSKKLPINQIGNYELKLIVKDWESGFTSDMDSSYKKIINFTIQ